MIIRNLGSGSRGNATLVAHEGRALLIDAGLGRERMAAGLGDLPLDGILITHRHADHLGRDAEKLGSRVWIERANWRAARRLGWISDDVAFFGEATFELGPFRVTAFPLSHPGRVRWQSFGFRIECGGKRFAYATDLGQASPEVVASLSHSDVVFLESNHDVDLEKGSGRAPGHIAWVLSDAGHLSNDQCAGALAGIRSPHTVILGHLSRECNRPELALRAARQVLPASTRLLVARQEGSTEDAEV